MVLKPGREAEAEAIFRKWELDFAVIGEVTDTGRMVLEFDGAVVCDIPLGPLADEAPLYDRPHLSLDEYKAWAGVKPLGELPESRDIAADLLKLMGSGDLASRRWVWEQYDQKVGADTVQPPGGDAAVVRVHGTGKALAITTDCTPRYCSADPYEGGKQAIAETWRNLCAVGARPLAATDCMNFGNPQRPEIMGQFVGCIEGMAEACRALDFPIVSGNVSLYNETKAEDGTSRAILPTPAIGGVGLIEEWTRAATIGFKSEGEAIFIVGGTTGQLGQSLWLRELHGREDGAPPIVDLEEERRNGAFVRALIAGGLVSAVHDIADGGAAVAIAEMALAGGIGADIAADVQGCPAAAMAFGEDQARYIVATSDPQALLARAADADRFVAPIGRTGGDVLRVAFDGGAPAEIPLARLARAHQGFFPQLMRNEPAVA